MGGVSYENVFVRGIKKSKVKIKKLCPLARNSVCRPVVFNFYF
jgi:hypothetical protein